LQEAHVAMQKSFSESDKREKALIEERAKLQSSIQQYKQIEQDFGKAKVQLQELEKLTKEHSQTKVLLAVKMSESESLKVKIE
jgi:hypothetical protein